MLGVTRLGPTCGDALKITFYVGTIGGFGECMDFGLNGCFSRGG